LMMLLGSVLVPVGGVFLAHFVVIRKPVDVERLYDASALPAFNIAGVASWLAGFIVYKLAAPIGATLPALFTSMVLYGLLSRSSRDPAAVVT
jgi:purine-cytosine permease-like protein